ncbi:MAG: CDP-alcohol phosphatidyltransferase family protein [Ignavibacteriaceae bacterium]|nr:CDP-alcohol phosphatidyltransferase family protein [Ignavibacteriaceae bacterium]
MNFTKKEIFTISNGLSTIRLLLVFPVWLSLNYIDRENFREITFILCIAAGLTDFLDGYFARKRNEVTEFGKIIDPVADKVLVAAIAFKLYLMNQLTSYFLLIIVIRDAIIFLGGLLLTIKFKKVLASNMLGKITVTVIGLVFLLIILGLDKGDKIFLLYYYASIVLIYTSFAAYLLRATELLKKNA